MSPIKTQTIQLLPIRNRFKTQPLISLLRRLEHTLTGGERDAAHECLTCLLRQSLLCWCTWIWQVVNHILCKSACVFLFGGGGWEWGVWTLTALSVQFHTLTSVTHTHMHTQKRPVASGLICVDGLKGEVGVTYTCTPLCTLIPARGKALCARVC